MDWSFLKKILRIFLGALLIAGGIGLIVLSFSPSFEITLAFLGFLLLCGGACTALYGIHSIISSK